MRRGRLHSASLNVDPDRRTVETILFLQGIWCTQRYFTLVHDAHVSVHFESVGDAMGFFVAYAELLDAAPDGAGWNTNPFKRHGRD